jgi:integrase
MDRGVFKSTKEGEKTTLKDALDRYLEEVSKHKKGHKREKGRIEQWKAHPLSSRYLASIGPKDIAEYASERKSEGYSMRTIQLELAIISHLYNYAAAKWGMRALENPVAPTRVKGTDPHRGQNYRGRNRTLSLSEKEKLFEHLNEEMQQIVTLAFETGMRRGELMSLTVSNVDLTKKIVKLEETKNGDSREVPLSPVAADTLKAVLGKKKVVGLDGKLWTLGPDRVTSVFASAAKEAGLKDIRFHDLRHTAATRLAGIYQAHELAKILGHKVLNMVMRYYNPTGEDLGRKMWDLESTTSTTKH